MTKNASIFLQRCILDRVFSSKITNMTYMYFLIRYNFVIFIVICLFYFFLYSSDAGDYSTNRQLRDMLFQNM